MKSESTFTEKDLLTDIISAELTNRSMFLGLNKISVQNSYYNTDLSGCIFYLSRLPSDNDSLFTWYYQKLDELLEMKPEEMYRQRRLLAEEMRHWLEEVKNRLKETES